MFRPFRPFYYFCQLEISLSFDLLFGNDWFASEVSFERKSFFLSLLSTESVNMDQKRSHVETGSTPEKRPAKRLTPTGSSKRNLFSSPSSGEPVSKLFFF